MGGRKTYPVKNVVGSDKSLISPRRKLASAINEESPEKIVQTTVNLFQQSKTGLNNLAAAINMYDFFKEQKEVKELKDIKKDVSDFWTKTKEEKSLKTSSEVDRIIVDSAVKVLKKRGKK